MNLNIMELIIYILILSNGFVGLTRYRMMVEKILIRLVVKDLAREINPNAEVFSSSLITLTRSFNLFKILFVNSL
jgi:hypothetical protein